MNDDSILGAAFGQLGQTVKKTGQQIVKIPIEAAKDVGDQVGGVKPAASAEGFGEPKQEKKQQWQSDEERIKFLRDIYGSAEQNSSEQVKRGDLQTQQNKKPTEFEKGIASKSPEEQKKLIELRQQLHKQTYYEPLVNPPKPKEERPAEKVEKEKKQEMQELQQKEAKKPPPLAVVREQNKAEMFRGASG